MLQHLWKINKDFLVKEATLVEGEAIKEKDAI